MCRAAFPVENVAPMMQHVPLEVAISAETGVIDVLDISALHQVAAGVGAFTFSPRFVIPAIWEELLSDLVVRGNPHIDVGVGAFRFFGPVWGGRWARRRRFGRAACPPGDD